MHKKRNLLYICTKNQPMKKAVILSFVFIFITLTIADAQRWRSRRYEAFIGAGTANLYSDIGGTSPTEDLFRLKDIQIKTTRPALTAGFKYKLNHRFYVRTNFTGAYLSGNDLGTRNALDRPGGGYQYQSWVFEPSAQVEIYVLPEDRSMGSMALYNRKGMVNGFSQIYLYFFAGGGGILNFPTVTQINTGIEVNGDEYFPEGGFDFKRFGVVFPIGIGIKYSITSYWTGCLEFGRRYTLTDYIEGYTSRFSGSSDMYDFVTFTASYKIRTNRQGLPVLFRRSGLN